MLELVDSIREKYEQSRGGRQGTWPKFDDLLKAFQDPMQKWKQIGELFSLSKDQVGRLYYRYFKALFQDTGTERWQKRLQKQREELIREVPLDRPVLGVIAGAAEEAGLTVHQMPYKGMHTSMRRKALVIEGHSCRIHLLWGRQRNHKNRMRCNTQAFLSQKEMTLYDAHIFLAKGYVQNQLTTRTFIVPTYLLRRIAPPSQHFSIWIPVERYPVYRNRPSRINWDRYENAWHLLEGE